VFDSHRPRTAPLVGYHFVKIRKLFDHLHLLFGERFHFQGILPLLFDFSTDLFTILSLRLKFKLSCVDNEVVQKVCHAFVLDCFGLVDIRMHSRLRSRLLGGLRETGSQSETVMQRDYRCA